MRITVRREFVFRPLGGSLAKLTAVGAVTVEAVSARWELPNFTQHERLEAGESRIRVVLQEPYDFQLASSSQWHGLSVLLVVTAIIAMQLLQVERGHGENFCRASPLLGTLRFPKNLIIIQCHLSPQNPPAYSQLRVV
ncbi:hypothetical protein BC629DRAFT_1442195 [Irpex lacteus]|nr:hypothetical protein BC629DRAFT_1442195 [Irpex lacteus]